MDLPESKLRQEYVEGVKKIESDIQEISASNAPAVAYEGSQKELDSLAKRFQKDERLGNSRFKLYELQSLVYYYQGRSDDAASFIQHAIDVHGGSYPRAEYIERLIEGETSGAAVDMNQEPPLELQALTKSLRTSAIIMIFISILSVYFIPWAIFYIVVASLLNPKKVPNRALVIWAAVLTLPLCLGIIPIIIDIEFWRMSGKIKAYQEQGASAFISDQEWLEGEPKRKRSRRIATTALLSLVAVMLLLIVAAIASGS